MKKFFYRVQKSDSISSVCEKFGISLHRVISLNNLKNDISEGDILYLEKEDGALYTVGPQDTIGSLAKKFNVTEEFIREKLKMDYVYCGLKINF